MKHELDHLPEGNRRELERVVEIVREGFARAIKFRSQPRFRNGKLLKIILFGSYARGDWVEDPVGRYFSDYDLLVVVDHEDLTDVPEFWLKTEDRLLEVLAEGTVLRTPVSLVYHSLDDVNEKLRLGRYFFIDILRDGVVLFEEPGHPFAEPQPLSPEEALRETAEYFEDRFDSAGKALKGAHFYMAEGDQGCCVSAPSGHRAPLPVPVPGPRAVHAQDAQPEPVALACRGHGAEVEAGLAVQHQARATGLCAAARGLYHGFDD
jgi:predicted nucleotidyltransferase